MKKRFTIETTYPLGITTFKGMNIPWLHLRDGNGNYYDGYGIGFNDNPFNLPGVSDNNRYQLDLLKTHGFRYLRLWPNIYYYMNADKLSVGYTGFRSEFLTNLNTYLTWCDERDFQLIILFDDCWYVFPWFWLADAPKLATYVQACKDFVNAIKAHPCVWCFEYGNEPYNIWQGNTTTAFCQGSYQDVGATKTEMTAFYISLYNQLKPLSPSDYFTVGSSLPESEEPGVGSASDFYQRHWPHGDPEGMSISASSYERPVIMSEYGSGFSADADNGLRRRFLQKGFPLHLRWALDQVITYVSPLNYTLGEEFAAFDGWKEATENGRTRIRGGGNKHLTNRKVMRSSYI